MPSSRERERDYNNYRRPNRSMSPEVKKRNWQFSSTNERSSHRYNRSPSPKRIDTKQPPKPSTNYSRKSRSRSPDYKKSFGSNEGSSRYPPKQSFKSRSPHHADASRLESRPRKRSLSPIRPKDHGNNRGKDEGRRQKNSSRSPDTSRYGVSSKKKPRQSSPPPQKKSSPVPPPKKNDAKGGLNTQRRVSSPNRKKASRTTLHKRFTTDDIEPFHLKTKDNVTIAILRNPRAEPSDDVTVKRIFDSSLFKMVHKKSAGQKPIFDREEIKVWKHDENLDDDHDFEERRLVRVKSQSKKPSDSLMRMSPDVLRKAFGVESGRDRSRSRSPNVRLNPRPDSRYESRFQQQLKRDEMNNSHKKRKEDYDKRGDRGGREEDEGRFQKKEDRRSREQRQTKDDDYDLRQALERRRSGRDEDMDGDSYDHFDRRKHQDHDDDRNVVVDQFKGRRPFSFEFDRERGRGRKEDRRGFGRGRGRGPRRQWSPRRNDRGDHEDYDSRDREYDRRRERFSHSPVNRRGGRGGGHFFGRSRGNFVQYEDERTSPPADDYYKYAQHDDRDLSPRGVRGRSRGGRFQSNRGFRGTRGGFRIRRRGWSFGSSGLGRGFLHEDTRSVERDGRRSMEHASDREWKHDMYDSVQSDDELPHSTTINN